MKISSKLPALLLAAAAACATPQRPAAPLAFWAPPKEWWNRAALEGGRLLERDTGTAHYITRAQARNLSEALDKLNEESGVAARVAIVKSDQLNAFAADWQGFLTVAFTLPFIAELGEDRDAVASVMGHELAHLKLGHGEARRHRQREAGVASHAVGTLLNAAGVPMGGAIAGLGASAVTAAFSRDEERDADRLGSKWAVAAGFDPCGGVRSIRALQARSQAFPIPFLSTHPGHEERIRRANELSIHLTNLPC